MTPALTVCKNCANTFEGKYCNNCGEKVYTDEDKKVSHFFHEIFHFTTHLDSKFFRTALIIFKRPGLLSTEYCEGKRKKYYKPVSFFLICIVLYLLFPLAQGLNLPFRSHIHDFLNYNLKFAKNWALYIMQHRKISEQILAERYDHISPKISKILLFLLLPLTAIVLNILFKKKKKYFFDHFIMATEFNSFYVVFSFFLMPLIAQLISLIFRMSINNYDDLVVFLPGLVIIFLILASAFKRFYSASTGEAIIKTILFFVGYFAVIFIYRIILFSVVMLAL